MSTAGRAARLTAGPAAGFLVFAAVAAAIVPGAGAVGSSGAWIFPDAHESDVLSGSTADSFYFGANASDWVADSFFADTSASAASVKVDLYNPTSGDLSNVQLFAAISDGTRFTDLSFEGADSGFVSYVFDNLSGGTPLLASGTALGAHGIYPAYYASYGVGTLKAGSANVRSVTVKADGDFAGGLILHLDYTAVDASGGDVTGPFDADMAILDHDVVEAGPCTNATFSLTEKAVDGAPSPGGTAVFNASWSRTGGDAPANVTLTMTTYFVLGAAAHALDGAFTLETTSTGTSTDGSRAVKVKVPELALDGDVLNTTSVLTWDSCGGVQGSASSFATAKVTSPSTGDVHTAGWWEEQLDHAAKGKGKMAFNGSDLALFLGRVALHSGVFVNASWNGTDPTGGDDAGWIDLGSFGVAHKVLEGKSEDAAKVRKAEREVLASWLNVASGALNLGTPLKVAEKRGHGGDDDDESESGEQGALAPLSSSYDTPGEILAFAEKQVRDWKGGNGASKDDLKLASRLCRALDGGALIPA